MSNVELLVLNSNTWKYLTVCKQISYGLFKNFTDKLFVYKLYIYIYIFIYVTIFNRVQLVLNQSFPSPKLVGISRIESSVSPTMNSYPEEE